MGRRSLPTDEFNLTERERKVLDFMKKTAAEKGYPPTVREICQELNVKSTSTIHKDLASLEKKGFIRKDPAKPRAIEIVGFDRHTENTNGPASGPASFAPSDSRNDQSFSDISERSDVIDIPLVGQGGRRYADSRKGKHHGCVPGSQPLCQQRRQSFHADGQRRKHDRSRYFRRRLYPGQAAECRRQRRNSSCYGGRF